MMGNDNYWKEGFRDAVYSAAREAYCNATRYRKPCYYANLYSYACGNHVSSLKHFLKPISTGNNLVLGSKEYVRGKGDYVEVFLCFNIPDDKLP